ncbi:hypothetical protein F441_11390 [Phytophthora nicotianae CJ01A1]|uniref:Ig-like domain-containing protein n=5 Tax=Phytophthora nicotianae TaxID=4792 RepID=V9EWI1_PHYNI|nr:hypothetical protein PPTG_23227 [Phytophthora nicotianae INRA-310]ETI43645.1 hypothetical protein F443_11472 [Phytophthora nicotianae P1569]ETL37140.1 hypothetical protein L916_11055 [Phytophthora nicotianae]ETO72329.1 hypothetical protein F444_11536 [Phytophthora nicotianae P1976]ETP13469.1 hypothetical protein F441_11390 [Phytophthora nicotianae CJ01A1]KUG01979.1 hypothetical protein AM587_10008010 [Phytophthora nicotianae]
MHVDEISFLLLLFVALAARLASAASVISTVTTSTTTKSTVLYPSLVECVCNTTLASAAVVKTSTGSSTQTQKYVLPSCLEDVFAETGIRWYLNGPLLPGVTYWRDGPPKDYSAGRAAQRLVRLGYRCSRVQLYDSSDPYY